MDERDLVQRLKDYAGGDWSDELGQIPVVMVQAAEVIEQYRGLLTQAMDYGNRGHSLSDEFLDEIDAALLR